MDPPRSERYPDAVTSLTLRRTAVLALVAAVALLAAAFIGRAVNSADDGADMMGDALGFLAQGRFESASIPPDHVDPYYVPTSLKSRYGILPSLVCLAFLGPAWLVRAGAGAGFVDGCAALTWAAGALLAALAFHRLARSLSPAASPWWIPGFLGGTFLWSYAADSYIEPWAAAGLAWAASELLAGSRRTAAGSALSVAAGCVGAFLLRPVTWVVAPVFLLAALVEWRVRADGARRALWLVAGLGAGACAVVAMNLADRGSATDFGYGVGGLVPFVHDAGAGLLGLTLSPGRGLLLYAPIALASLAMARRLRGAALLLCTGAPLVLALVVARWYGWHGGCCWGPRFLLPILPLVVAPAVLAPRRLSAALLAAGFVVNLPGVLVAPGAFQGYVESLIPPAASSWPSSGGERVSEIPFVSPLYGHAWLLAGALAPGRLPAPWLRKGARETVQPPPLGAFLAPRLARRLAGLPPAAPFLPRLLIRASAGYLLRERPAEAARFAEAALELDPSVPEARTILAEARRRLGGSRVP